MLSTDQRIGDDLILERMYAAEQALLTQTDALDMKASYLLVALVFLAQLSATFLAKPQLPCFYKGSQWLSCLILVCAGIFLFLELRVKNFRGEDALELEAWRDKIAKETIEKDEYKTSTHPDDYLRSRIVWGLIVGSKPRIVRGEQHNAKKVRYLKIAYWLTAAAFLLDILFIILSW